MINSVFDEKAVELLNIFPRRIIYESSIQEQQISLTTLRMLAKGKPLSPEKVALKLGLTEKEIVDSLKGESAVFFDDRDNIIGYFGLAIKPMTHQFMVNGTSLSTWCAWDALFLPEVLNATALAESTCPVTNKVIRLTVSPEGISEVEPEEVVMSFVTPEGSKIVENVVKNFCHYVHFFSNTEAAQSWLIKNEGTFILTLDEAFYLAKMKNSIHYKDVLNN